MRKIVIAVVICLSVVSLSTAADARAAMRKPTNIPHQALRSALQRLSKERDFQLVFRTDVVGDLQTEGARGDLTRDEALEQLLSGTGLIFRLVDEHTVTILSARSSTEVPSSGRAGGADGGSANQAMSEKEGDRDGSLWERSRLAQASEGVPAEPSSVENADKHQSHPNMPTPESDRRNLEEVVVTGTHIHGSSPAGAAVTIYSSADIQQAGAATLDQFARLLPENFSNVDTVSNQLSNAGHAPSIAGSTGNTYAGSSFNLHGIGPTATLTLLNGHRLAPAGSDGSLTDISLIPLSGIDHVEVLPDGASAIYGADAVAGIVNIVTRHSFRGAETSVRYGDTTDNGASQITIAQLLGTSWSSGNVFLNYEYNDQADLDASQRDYIPPQGGPASLIPETRRNSVLVSGNQQLLSGTTLSLDALYSRRDFLERATTTSSIFSENLTQDGYARQWGATATLEQALPNSWRADLVGNYSSVNQHSPNSTSMSGEGFTPGIENVLTETNSHVWNIDLLADGKLIGLPGGALRTALGISYRRETLSSSLSVAFPPTAPVVTTTSASRDVFSAYVELLIPLVGDENSMPGVKRLEISAAGRYDRYSDFGSTVNPKIGVSWNPLPGLTLRGSFGTSFTAPLLFQLFSPVQIVAAPTPDSQAAEGVTNAVKLSGGNPALRAEKSRSFNGGIDWKPEAAIDALLSLTYFHIDFDQRISTPPIPGTIDLGSPLLAPFVLRNPPLSLTQSYFSNPGFQFDYTGLGPTGISAFFFDQFANLAATKQSGVDLTAQSRIPVSFGKVDLSLSVSRLLTNEFQTASATPFFSLQDTFGEPTRWRGRAGAGFATGPFLGKVFVNYVNSYRNSLFQPPQTVASWTTMDLYFGYNTEKSDVPDALRNINVALSVQNAANANPPRVNLPSSVLLPGEPYIPFDPTNASPLGRFISLSVAKRF